MSADIEKRYSRQLALVEIGMGGQDALANAHVAIVGAGGLGNHVLTQLVGSGVGNVTIFENDRVDLSNLPRQLLYNEDSIGKAKGDEAVKLLKRKNSNVTINHHNLKIDNVNANKLLDNIDVIVDCTDNFESRYAINKAACELSIDLVSAAVIGFDWQVATFRGYKKDAPCYQCFCPSINEGQEMPTCLSQGVFSPAVAIAASFQASEVLRTLLDLDDENDHSMFIGNMLKNTVRKVKLHKNSHCNVCNNTTKSKN